MFVSVKSYFEEKAAAQYIWKSESMAHQVNWLGQEVKRIYRIPQRILLYTAGYLTSQVSFQKA